MANLGLELEMWEPWKLELRGSTDFSAVCVHRESRAGT